MRIRTRFTLLFAGIVGIILFFFSLSIHYLSETHRLEDFRSRLEYRGVTKLRSLLAPDGGVDDRPAIAGADATPQAITDLGFLIIDPRSEVIHRDTVVPVPAQEDIASIRSGEVLWMSASESERVGFLHMHQGGQYVILAQGHDKLGRSYMANLKRILIFRGLILLLIIFISGWLFAGRFLKPISDIVGQANLITYRNMDQRLRGTGTDDEIGRLISTFNSMLDRLEVSFNAQKKFVSNASHELRNPLAAIKGHVDVALQKDRDNEDYREVLRGVSMDIARMRTLTDHLLELANSDEGLAQHFKEVRIDDLLWNAREEMLRQHPDYTVTVHFGHLMDSDRGITCKGDPDLLGTAFMNLMDNACKFSEDRAVEVRITAENGSIRLLFIDNGIGIAESDLRHVYDPFFRGGNTGDFHGHGIGLSLVQRIIKLHGGRTRIRSKVSEGTTVELTLPNLSGA